MFTSVHTEPPSGTAVDGGDEGDIFMNLSKYTLDRISNILCHLTVLASITTGISAWAIYFNRRVVEASLDTALTVFFIFLAFQFVSSIYFLSEKRARKYQRAQIVIACITGFKSTFDLYFLYYVVNLVKELPQENITIGIISLIAGFVIQLVRATSIYIQNNSVTHADAQIEDKLFGRKGIKPRIYFVLFFAVLILAKGTGYFDEGYSLIILYQAFILQLFNFSVWPGIGIATYYKFKTNFISKVDSDDDTTIAVNDNLINTKWWKLIIIKLIQYLLLFFLMPLITIIKFESLSTLTFFVYVLCLYNLLKWICRYRITGVDLYCINNILSAFSFVLLLMFVAFLSNVESVKTSEFFSVMLIGFIMIVWFWSYNIVQFFRRN